VELLVVIGIIALLAGMLLPVVARAIQNSHKARCSSHESQIYKGIRLYLSNFNEFFPLAWLKTADDGRLDQLSYWRFLLQESCETGFSRQLGPGPQGTPRARFTRNREFWSDAAKGHTRDYFGPSLAFRGWLNEDREIDTAKTTDGFDKHAQYSQLTQDVSSTQRPILADVDASYPDDQVSNDETKNNDTASGHGKDLHDGWTIVPQADRPTVAADIEIFIGVGKSLRTDGDYNVQSARFDFRHSKAANFLFLDGHVDAVHETDDARLRLIHDRWNNLKPVDK